MDYRMDYRIRRSKGELDSTGYVEIAPGKYSGKHWQDGSLFIWGDAFGMAEGILAKHFPEYDHLAMNDIPKHVGTKVIAEWRDAARRIPTLPPGKAYDALNLRASYRERLDEEFDRGRVEIAEMLELVALECDAFYQRGEWVCILGV
jgi:hypothetical protein